MRNSTGVETPSAPHQRDDAEAVEFRQHAIEHDDVEAIGARALITLAAVAARRSAHALARKTRRDELGGSLVVLDNQNLHAADLAERRDPARAHESSSGKSRETLNSHREYYENLYRPP